MSEAWHCLVSIMAYDPVTATRREVRASSAQLRQITALDNKAWPPAITKAPTLSLQLFEGEFAGGVGAGNASISLNLGEIAQNGEFADVARYWWQGADVTVWCGKAAQAWPWRVGFRGQITQASGEGRMLSISASVNGDSFARKVLTASYAGTGGAEGGEDIKGQVKPLILGWAQNVEPVLIDAVENVYQFSGYGEIEAVTTLYERASPFGASTGNYANYAALVAAAIPPGGWGTCLAQGMIRLGAPAFGVITGDVRGHEVTGATPRLTGAVIRALATLAGVDAGNLATASLTALDAAVPYPINLVLTDQVDFDEVARRLALPCNYQAGVSLTGQFFVAGINLAASPAFTLHAQGKRMPQVVSSREENVSRPFAKVVMGAARSWRVHSAEEIAGGFVLRGIYGSTVVYRNGDIVNASDGCSFVYINATPAAGNAPPVAPATSNAHWSLAGAATAGAPSGTTVGGLSADVVASTITPAGLIAPDAVVESSINVPTLSGISANVGTLTAGVIQSASGAAKFDLDAARIIFNNGAVMKVTGLGFGSSSQFLEWFGPSQASLSTCTESNAISYLKTNGDAYFGGSLSAGIIRNSGQTTATGSGAAIIVGPFGTNGGNKSVVLSFNWQLDGFTSSDSAGSDSGSATIILERSINGGSWTTLTTLNVSGSVSWEAMDAFGFGEVYGSMSGSTTYVDTNATVTSDYRYRGRITAADYPVAAGLNSGFAENQNITVISTEA